MPDDQPMDLDDIRKNAKLCAALMAFMKKEHNSENFSFYFDKGNAEALYTKYISPRSNTQVNLKSATQRGCEELDGKWDDRGWRALIEKAKDEIHNMVRADVLPRFYKSDQYEEYVKKNKVGDPKKAAKLLGISDVSTLKEAMEALAMGDERTAKSLLEKLVKSEKLKENAAAMMKALERSGLC